MIRSLLLGMVALLGLAVGGTGMLASQRPPLLDAPPPPTVTTSLPEVTAGSVPEPEEGLVLVWTPTRMPEGLAAAISELPTVETATEVRAGLLHLELSRDAAGQVVDRPLQGLVIPLEAMAVDPDSYARFLPTGADGLVRSLRLGEAVLGSTSAGLRRLSPGGTLVLEGEVELSVVGILEDGLIGAAEVLISLETADTLGLTVPRHVLVAHRGEREAVEQAILDLVPPGLPTRVRGPGETPYLRHGDAVLPQALIKHRFGEFAYRPTAGQEFVQDPAWAEENIVTTRVPLLGAVTCHRHLLPALEGAMQELEEQGLAIQSYQGCWNPRFIAGGTGISRHAWGAALDFNFDANPTGVASAQDPRLVEIMEHWGFTWGGFWLIPDPAHFEYLRPPSP